MVVNTTLLGNVTSFQGMASFTNDAVSGVLFTGGIFALFFIMLLVLNKNDEPFVNVFVISSWSMFVLSLFLWLAHLTPTFVSIVFLVFSGFGTLYLYASR